MTQQWVRKASLFVTDPARGKALEMSEMHFRFKCSSGDTESPNNASIRVYNLSPDTVNKVRNEYTEVVIQAGYEGNFGVIFSGTIKQFRIGRENATDSYLDILAADGDIGYNYSMVNRTVDKQSSGTAAQLTTIVNAMGPQGIKGGYLSAPPSGGVLPRGKVLFGMARTLLRQNVWNTGSTWSIQQGQINVIPLKGYLPGSAVVLNAQTGMIGQPESTIDGIKVRVLLNPRIQAGTAVKIDNKSVNQTLQANPDVPIPYNQYTGVQLFAKVTDDGVYRVYVAEHEGDTRGQNFYTEITALSINPDTNLVASNG